MLILYIWGEELSQSAAKHTTDWFDSCCCSVTSGHLSEMERKWSTITFLLCLAGTIYFVISIECYCAHSKYCKKFVTRKLLVIIIVCLTLSSFLWATLHALFIRRVEIVKLAKLYIAIFAYTGALLAITTILSSTLLKYVKLKRPSPSIKHAHDSHLTKKIAMILAVTAVTYLPMIIFSNIATYSVVNSKDTSLIKKTVRDLRWIPTSCQLNVILNSIVYLMSNNHMRTTTTSCFVVGMK